MSAIVYSNCSGSSRDPNTGLIVRLVANEPWHASDPFVEAMPHLFSAAPTVVRGTVTVPKGKKRGVEQATAAPGEIRG